MSFEKSTLFFFQKNLDDSIFSFNFSMLSAVLKNHCYMKKTALTLFLSLTVMTFGSIACQNVLTETETFGTNPGDLQMFTYVPEDISEHPPLVVVLHGCAQSAEDIARQSGWNRLADQHQFVVLYPQQKATNNIQKCFNWFVEEDIQKGKGESLSIKEMIDQMVKDLSVDTSRIFITGMSAGGAMTNVMMATFPDYFQAGAIMSGVPYGGATNLSDALALMAGGIEKSDEEWAQLVKDQNPSYEGSYPELIIFQGTDDPIVKEPNANKIVQQWGTLHGLADAPSEQKTLEGLPAIQRSSWEKADQEVIVRYDIEGLGHAIAIDPGEGAQKGGQEDIFAKDVDFYSTYWIAEFFGILK
jgi:poly(hydroxyalkanoate) depolymerase family esterase